MAGDLIQRVARLLRSAGEGHAADDALVLASNALRRSAPPFQPRLVRTAGKAVPPAQAVL